MSCVGWRAILLGVRQDVIECHGRIDDNEFCLWELTPEGSGTHVEQVIPKSDQTLHLGCLRIVAITPCEGAVDGRHKEEDKLSCAMFVLSAEETEIAVHAGSQDTLPCAQVARIKHLQCDIIDTEPMNKDTTLGCPRHINERFEFGVLVDQIFRVLLVGREWEIAAFDLGVVDSIAAPCEVVTQESFE